MTEPVKLHFGELKDQVPSADGIRPWLEKVAIFKGPVTLLAILIQLAALAVVWRFHYFSACGVPFTLLFLGLYQSLSARRAPSYLSRILDLPTTLITVPVRVQVRYGSMVSWRDEGIVTFQDGFIHFQGTRSNFGLRSQDFQSLRSDSIYSSEKPSKMAFTFRPTDLVLISKIPELKASRFYFQPYDSLDGLGKDLFSKFHEGINTWHKTPSAIAYSTFPQPTLLRPDSIVRKEISVWLGVTSLVFAVICFTKLIPVPEMLAGGIGLAILDFFLIRGRLAGFNKERQTLDRHIASLRIQPAVETTEPINGPLTVQIR